RRGVRHRAQIPRDAALPGGADLDQPDPLVSGGTRARPAAFVLIVLMEPLAKRDVLLADIGGTNSRFALAGADGRPARMLIIEDDSVADLESAIIRYLHETGAQPGAAVLAVAGPLDGGDEVALTNRAWRFRRSALARRFGFAQLRVVNDFEAIAWALTRLAPD